ncbi:hypothetical protein [Veillonella sp.]|uniref:phage protein n=1 Tax=Veillonella sp. TaxID=1926307 RepID=UPI0025F64B01|nr:hypothetical protein [Veillonella sp.]
MSDFIDTTKIKRTDNKSAAQPAIDNAFSAINNKLYGRQWRVLIQTKEDKALDVTELRCTFTINKYATGQPSVCHLMIYNLNAQTEGNIIKEGFYVQLEAGYAAQYGIIFSGQIIQVFRNREEGINYRLEILAVDGSAFLDLNFVRTTLAAGSTPRDVVVSLASVSKQPIETEEVSENMDQAKLPRPKVLFGRPKDYLNDISKGNGSFYWINDGKLTVRKFTDPIPENHCIVLTPTTGLVGTPEYTDEGIRIVSLLNPLIVVNGMIKIDNSIINRQAINLPNGKGGGQQKQSQQSVFDQDGEYQVYSIHHAGDTHGEVWTTEVIGIGRNGRAGLPLMVDSAEQDIRG